MIRFLRVLYLLPVFRCFFAVMRKKKRLMLTNTIKRLSIYTNADNIECLPYSTNLIKSKWYIYPLMGFLQIALRNSSGRPGRRQQSPPLGTRIPGSSVKAHGILLLWVPTTATKANLKNHGCLGKSKHQRASDFGKNSLSFS